METVKGEIRSGSGCSGMVFRQKWVILTTPRADFYLYTWEERPLADLSGKNAVNGQQQGSEGYEEDVSGIPSDPSRATSTAKG